MFSRNKDDDIGPLKGFPALMHKTFLFITYPFRKPLHFVVFLLVIAAIAYAAPLFMGAKPAEVHTWYINKAKQIDIANIKSNITGMVKPKKEEKGIDKLVEIPRDPRAIRRQMFEVASKSSAPQRVDVLAEEAQDVVSIAEIVRDDDESGVMEPVIVGAASIEKKIEESQSPQEYKISSEKARLKYLADPVEIFGTARVINANELEVNGTYLFLYGIYSNLENERGVKAGIFLRNALKNERVRCEIIAYTAEEVATANCYAGEVSINRIMVEKGFSDKVSLE